MVLQPIVIPLYLHHASQLKHNKKNWRVTQNKMKNQNEIEYRVVKGVNSMCKYTKLFTASFDSKVDALAMIYELGVENKKVDSHKPYYALTKVESGCVHSSIGFFQ